MIEPAAVVGTLAVCGSDKSNVLACNGGVAQLLTFEKRIDFRIQISGIAWKRRQAVAALAADPVLAHADTVSAGGGRGLRGSERLPSRVCGVLRQQRRRRGTVGAAAVVVRAGQASGGAASKQYRRNKYCRKRACVARVFSPSSMPIRLGTSPNASPSQSPPTHGNGGTSKRPPTSSLGGWWD